MDDSGTDPDITSVAEELLEDLTALHAEAEPIEIPKGIVGWLYRLRRAIEAVTTQTGKASWIKKRIRS